MRQSPGPFACTDCVVSRSPRRIQNPARAGARARERRAAGAALTRPSGGERARHLGGISSGDNLLVRRLRQHDEDRRHQPRDGVRRPRLESEVRESKRLEARALFIPVERPLRVTFAKVCLHVLHDARASGREDREKGRAVRRREHMAAQASQRRSDGTDSRGCAHIVSIKAHSIECEMQCRAGRPRSSARASWQIAGHRQSGAASHPAQRLRRHTWSGCRRSGTRRQGCACRGSWPPGRSALRTASTAAARTTVASAANAGTSSTSKPSKAVDASGVGAQHAGAEEDLLCGLQLLILFNAAPHLVPVLSELMLRHEVRLRRRRRRGSVPPTQLGHASAVERRMTCKGDRFRG